MTAPAAARAPALTQRGAPARCPNCGDLLAGETARCPRDGTLGADRFDPLAHATLAGRYRLIARLGRGGMSSVYLARHLVIDRLAAVKILRRDLAGDPVQRDRFLREARAVNRIQHENIIDITDYGETSEGLVFLVMEYVPGDSLLSLIARGPSDPRRVADIGCQIAGALGRAHQMNVVHRDLKPDNVILTRGDDGRDAVKLLDFGISKMMDAPSLTQQNRIFGTPGYIAPEYVTTGATTPKTDLYALGAVLYELVTGALPFDAETISDLLMKHVNEAPVPPRKRVPSVPEAFEALILRCLAKSPDARHRDAFHLRDELRALRGALDSPNLPSPLPHTGPQRASPLHVPGVGSRDDETPTQLRPAVSAEDEDTAHYRSAAPIAAVQEEPTQLLDAASRRGLLGIASPDGLDEPALPRAWSAFLAALRARLDETRWTELPRAASERLAAMEVRVAAMRSLLERTELCKVRMIGLEVRGRDFRDSIGVAMDAVAGELSSRERTREGTAARRQSLDAARIDARARAARGDADAEGEADATMWEVAACDALLRESSKASEDLEFQLGTLSGQLDRLNESLEADQAALLEELGRCLDEIRAENAGLRRAVDELAPLLGGMPASTNR